MNRSIIALAAALAAGRVFAASDYPPGLFEFAGRAFGTAGRSRSFGTTGPRGSL